LKRSRGGKEYRLSLLHLGLIKECNKSRMAIAKAAFNKKKSLCTNSLGIKLRKKVIKCYIWSVALCGAETWTVPTVD
jgi:hypothetical protein